MKFTSPIYSHYPDNKLAHQLRTSVSYCEPIQISTPEHKPNLEKEMSDFGLLLKGEVVCSRQDHGEVLVKNAAESRV